MFFCKCHNTSSLSHCIWLRREGRKGRKIRSSRLLTSRRKFQLFASRTKKDLAVLMCHDQDRGKIRVHKQDFNMRVRPRYTRYPGRALSRKNTDQLPVRPGSFRIATGRSRLNGNGVGWGIFPSASRQGLSEPQATKPLHVKPCQDRSHGRKEQKWDETSVLWER